MYGLGDKREGRNSGGGTVGGRGRGQSWKGRREKIVVATQKEEALQQQRLLCRSDNGGAGGGGTAATMTFKEN